MDGSTDGRVNGKIHKWKGLWIKGLMDGSMDGKVNGKIHRMKG